jgi:hypothetical protein
MIRKIVILDSWHFAELVRLGARGGPGGHASNNDRGMFFIPNGQCPFEASAR